MEETRREMKGPSLNMNDVNKLTNMVPGAQSDRSDLRAKMRNKINNMASNRMGYHAQSVSQVKKEQREAKMDEEQKLKEEEEEIRLEKKREKNRAKKKRRREREKGLNNIVS